MGLGDDRGDEMFCSWEDVSRRWVVRQWGDVRGDSRLRRRWVPAAVFTGVGYMGNNEGVVGQTGREGDKISRLRSE